jgi:hypothetical protein
MYFVGRFVRTSLQEKPLFSNGYVATLDRWKQIRLEADPDAQVLV